MLSIGMNSKLGKKVAIFNLPSGKTCPGKTVECKNICYAHKAERMYPSALKSRESNYKESKKKDFVDNMVAELRKNKTKIVRIHESGDFYSQSYLDSWIVICKICKDIKFLAFTKSFYLDFSKVPDNVAIYWSVDSTTVMQPSAIRPRAMTVEDKGHVPYGFRYCGPVGKNLDGSKNENHYNYCGDKCKFCWNKRSDVCWAKH